MQISVSRFFSKNFENDGFQTPCKINKVNLKLSEDPKVYLYTGRSIQNKEIMQRPESITLYKRKYFTDVQNIFRDNFLQEFFFIKFTTELWKKPFYVKHPVLYCDILKSRNPYFP